MSDDLNFEAQVLGAFNHAPHILDALYNEYTPDEQLRSDFKHYADYIINETEPLDRTMARIEASITNWRKK